MNDLLTQLKTLHLSGIVEVLPSRLTHAQEKALPYADWLSLLLQDELERRSHQGLANRLRSAAFEGDYTFENYDLTSSSLEVQRLIKELQKGQYLSDYHHVIIMGQTGTGKSHLAQALGNQACRQGKKVKFMRAKKLWEAFEEQRRLCPASVAAKRLHLFYSLKC